MSRYMYNVMVEGSALAVFDTADEALRFAMHKVYLGPDGFNQARATLERGEETRYAYGFSTVHIVPVKKRAIATTEGGSL